MNKQIVSVIIPVYNCERYLGDAVNSIIKQDYRPIEIIVVDDGSNDGTADIARSYKEVQYIYQPNQGPCSARNTGVAAAQGEFIAFLDADDIWLPNKLRIQVDYLITNPEIGFVVAKGQMHIEKGIEKPPWYRKHLFEEDFDCFRPSSMVVRRNVLEKVGLWNPDFRYGETGEWLSRAKDMGISYAILPETLLVLRVHDQNLTYNLDKVRSNILSALKASVDRKRKNNTMESDNNLDNE
jgi:glycosyltransferase involved in cell wall biosynthesis